MSALLRFCTAYLFSLMTWSNIALWFLLFATLSMSSRVAIKWLVLVPTPNTVLVAKVEEEGMRKGGEDGGGGEA